MSDLLGRLRTNQQRGSKPRCHLITHGTRAEVATRLTALVSPYGEITERGHWMPDGFDDLAEAQFHRVSKLLRDDQCRQIRNWWFRICRGGRQTSPSFDIASTCMVDGIPGLLLVEAKAHVGELKGEERGKPLMSNASEGEKNNHEHIAQAIGWANPIFAAATGLEWRLSRDNCYQMSNRFAMACKLTSIGLPVILVYLGFLNAKDMSRGNERPFGSSDQWRQAVLAHSSPILPPEVWNHRWTLHGQTFAPLIRSTETPFDKPATERLSPERAWKNGQGSAPHDPRKRRCSLNGKHVLDDNMGA